MCINTARLSVDEQTSKNAFLGKTFEQECDDVASISTHLYTEGVISKSTPIFFVTHSFGGTTLLGTPLVLQQAAGIIMVASGCGKSPTTDKPLLQSLYAEESLLEPLRAYSGVFMYIRGTNDTVVPKESQEKIIGAATSARARIVSDIRGAEHNLTGGELGKTPPRSLVLAAALDMVVVLGSR